MARTPNKYNEPVAYAEIESVLHRNAGNAKVKTYTAVNKPVKVDSSTDAQRIGKVRVEMHVKEDRNVNGDCIYEKNICLKQIRDDDSAMNISDDEESEDVQPKGPLSKVEHCLKNMIDNIDRRLGQVTNYTMINTALAAAGFIMALLAIWKLFF